MPPEIKEYKLTTEAIEDAPDLQPEDKPDGEWFEKPWRILSAGIIEGHWIEFPEEVLRKALSLFNDNPLFMNHNKDVARWLGKIERPVWKEVTEEIPTGVNAMVRINRARDKQLGADIELAIKEGILRCGSVTIRGVVEQSHQFDSKWEFYDMLGREVDGEIVRYIFTEILAVDEFSIVYAGADPHAVAQEQLSKNNETQTLNDNKTNDINKEDSVELKEFLAELGIPEGASDTEIKATIVALKTKAKKQDEQYDKMREDCKAMLTTLKEAGLEVMPGADEVIEGNDVNTLFFLHSVLKKDHDNAFPENGRSSEEPETASDFNVNLAIGGV